MKREILALIYDYSLRGKLADAEFIVKLSDIVIKARGLSSYIKNVRFVESIYNADGNIAYIMYSPMTSDIVVNISAIRGLLSEKKDSDKIFTKFEQIMFRNLEISQKVLHDLEHGFQHKRIDIKSNQSFEANLLRAGFILPSSKENLLEILLRRSSNLEELSTPAKVQELLSEIMAIYKKYYIYNPMERLADIDSYKMLISMLKEIRNEIKPLYEYMKASLVEILLFSYPECWDQNGICPTQFFLYGTDQKEVWYNYDFVVPDYDEMIRILSKRYDLNQRLRLGLPIHTSEYVKKDDWLYTTNKYKL